MSDQLHVFDFDDTLVKTKSFVYVTHSNGKTDKLTPGQYAVYVKKAGDKFDYKDFEKVYSYKRFKLTFRVQKFSGSSLFKKKSSV